VLLIEDDPAVREGLQLALTHLGHDVIAAPAGESGLEAAATQSPDVVVLDLMLPGIDGFEVCRRLRRTGSLPIIMLTARSDDFDVVAGLEAGADDYVAKPVRTAGHRPGQPGRHEGLGCRGPDTDGAPAAAGAVRQPGAGVLP
jgi:DNA-binding response OmpR family regulator